MHGEDLGIQIPTVGANDSGPRSKDRDRENVPWAFTVFHDDVQGSSYLRFCGNHLIQ